MKIGIMGFGHLGRCFAQGLLKTKVAEHSEICVSAKSEKTKQLARNMGFEVKDNEALTRCSDVIVIALKSKVFCEVAAQELSPALFNGKIVLSFMAGMTMAEIQPFLGAAQIVRAIPSIAIAQGNGVTGYTNAPLEVVQMLNSLGYAFQVEEKDIEKVTAFASCGIGFAAYMLNAYQKAGVAMGFSPEESEKITAMTFQGALDLMDFENTVKHVATKGGATEQGVLYFEKEHLPDILLDGMKQAYNRMTK